jgi:hypothetical protein
MEARPGHEVKKGVLEMSLRAYSNDKRLPRQGDSLTVLMSPASTPCPPLHILMFWNINR